MGLTIKIKNISKSYSKHIAVDDVSLEIKHSEITGFVGKNGAGKSTLLRCITNMISADNGTIEVLGLDSRKHAKQIKEKLVYMPSETVLYPEIKVRDYFNLLLNFDSISKEEQKELFSEFDLDMHKKVSELSLGNKKKLAIVLSFFRKSEILIMDEPTNGLDPLMQQLFFRELIKLKNQNKTIFLSSHNLADIEKYADRVIFIKDGKIVHDEYIREIKNKRKYKVRYKEKNLDEINFEYCDDINKLIYELSKKDIEDLKIRQKTIEEEFINLYE